MSAPERVTRIAAYALLVQHDHLLLCRLSRHMTHAGRWTLPGGGIEFGEDPEAAMIREVEEETGLLVASTGVAGIDSFTQDTPHRRFHGVRIIYSADVIGGELRYEQDGTTDMCQWHPIDALTEVPVVELVTAAVPWLRRDGR